jgi:hypothetical protein
MTISDRNTFPVKSSQDRGRADLEFFGQHRHGRSALVELHGLLDLTEIERGAPTANLLSLEVLEHRVAMDVELGRQIVHREALAVAGNELLDLL